MESSCPWIVKQVPFRSTIGNSSRPFYLPGNHSISFIPSLKRVRVSACQSANEDHRDENTNGNGGTNKDIENTRKMLEQSIFRSQNRVSGKELREMVLSKYGCSYEMRLYKRSNRVYFQIMWKYLEQKSFHLTEEMYLQQLDAVAEFLNIWGVADMVREKVRVTRERPGYTGGGGAKAVSIPLDVSRGDGRGREWMDHF